MSKEEIKPKSDKRKVTSKANMQKARLAKLEQLKQKREKNKSPQYEIYSDSESSSDSENEVIIVKGKNKKNQKKTEVKQPHKQEDFRSELNELKDIINNLTIKKKKRKERKPKQVIQFVNPTVQPKSNPEIDGLKQRILVNF